MFSLISYSYFVTSQQACTSYKIINVNYFYKPQNPQTYD